MCEKYIETREKYARMKPSTTPVEQKRLLKMTDMIVGGIVIALAPEILQKLISNIANRWTRALLKMFFPVARLAGVLGGGAGIGFAGIASAQWLAPYIRPVLDKIVGTVLHPGTRLTADGRIVFGEYLLKCLIGGLLAGRICRVCIQYNGNTPFSSGVMVGLHGCGLYFLYQDTQMIHKLASFLQYTPVIAFFMNSQMGRMVMIVGSSRLLLSMERTPYTLYFYTLFICLFRVFSYATGATPNMF